MDLTIINAITVNGKATKPSDFVTLPDKQAQDLIDAGYAIRATQIYDPHAFRPLRVTPGGGGVLPDSLQALASSGLVSSILPLTGAKRTGQDGRIEKYTLLGGVETEVYNVPASAGPGVVTAFQFIAQTVGACRNSVMKVYVDGATTPDLNFEMQFLGGIYTDQTVIRAFANKYVGFAHLFANGQPEACFFNYPIPFSAGVRVTITPPGDSQVWVQDEVDMGHDEPWRIKSYGTTFAGRLSAVTAAQLGGRFVKLLDKPSGANKRGVIAGVSMAYINPVGHTNIFDYLECNIVVYQGTQPRDGTVAPFYNSTGGEDFFKSAYYFFQGEGNYAEGSVFVNSKGRNGNNISVVQDFVARKGGIAYDDGCLFTIETGLATDPGNHTGTVDIAFQTWYYEPKA